ncbi:MAG: hypothetical protein ACPGQL_05070 [Thermoplasmatota archaeon]
MGLAQAAAFALLAGASLFMGGLGVNAAISAQDEVDAARQDAAERQRRAVGTDHRVDEVTLDALAAEVDVLATNQGTATLQADRGDVLIDGYVATAYITATTIDGATSTTWTNGAQVTYTLDYDAFLEEVRGISPILILLDITAFVPQTAAVATDNGIVATWRA